MSGLTWAKVRSMFDHAGNPVTEAKLSEAVQIIGWKDLPSAGETILEVENERKARMVMRYREGEKYKVMAEEHKVAADKKHEEYLKVNFSVTILSADMSVFDAAFYVFLDTFSNTKIIW